MKIIMNNKEAADYLGYSPKALEVSRSTGVLSGKPAPAHFKIGEKTVRYRVTDLNSWIDQNLEPANKSA